MAITWNDKEAKYVGRVLKVYNKDYRAMSDVYTYATFALVMGDDGVPVEIMVNANFECDVSGGHAEVDANPGALQDYARFNAQLEHQAEERRQEWIKAKADAENNRPVKGKKMVVCKGRKIPLGTVGIVAYVSGSGSVLLKDEAHWQDRKADGVWVNAGNLRAV